MTAPAATSAVRPRDLQLPAGLAWDAVVMPQALGVAVRHTLDVLFVFEQEPAVIEAPECGRMYFLTEPGRGGVWGADVWTLDAGSWLPVPHLPNGGPLPVSDLRRALNLAYPAFRWCTAGLPPQQSTPGGIL